MCELIPNCKEAASLVSSLLPGQVDYSNLSANNCIGFSSNGVLVGGCVFTDYTGFDITLNIASKSPLWARHKNLILLSRCVFEHLDCLRATAKVPRRLKKQRKLYEKLGFKLEGVRRKAFDGKQDLFLFGMMKEECPWLADKYGKEEERV